ncbi:hypothetical protein [Parabacteroides gordonii]|jgi:hypothetical protein|uniref:hypothetical protein n=1 Tax=Parabacteroides gordonii TaxID=574930 RepID=UPI00241BF4D8|nr:hypothetical protein [Parabacteroides gordonii]
MKSIQIILVVILVSTLGACSTKGGQSTETDEIFKGVWFNSEEPLNENIDPFFMYINIDLYAKTIEERGGGEMTHGDFYVNNGFFEQGGDITSARLEGNKAYIEYIDPAALTYSATLTYIPETRQLKFEDGDIVKKGGEEEEMILSGNLYGQYHRAIPSELILDALLPHPRSARKGLCIYGNVSKVTEDNGNVIEFDKIGNILKEVSNNGEYTETYEYVVAYKKYTLNGSGPYNIIYSDHERKDLGENKADTEGSVEYYFDDQDRIIKYTKDVWMSSLEKTFTYNGKQKLPDSMKAIVYGEYGTYTTTEVYEYPEVDKQGNWLKRKVTRTKENSGTDENYENDYTETITDPPYIETRIIEYF